MLDCLWSVRLQASWILDTHKKLESDESCLLWKSYEVPDNGRSQLSTIVGVPYGPRKQSGGKNFLSTKITWIAFMNLDKLHFLAVAMDQHFPVPVMQYCMECVLAHRLSCSVAWSASGCHAVLHEVRTCILTWPTGPRGCDLIILQIMLQLNVILHEQELNHITANNTGSFEELACRWRYWQWNNCLTLHYWTFCPILPISLNIHQRGRMDTA